MSAIEWPWSSRMRPLLQSEAAECGLACLAMVALHHGHRVDLTSLRQLYPISIKGTTLEQLMAVASELELASRAVRLDLDELDKLQLPAILHWDLNHFVVLEKCHRRGAIILDPALGRREVTTAELSRHFTGVAMELTPTPQFVPIEARRPIRLSSLWSKLVNYRGAVAQVLLLSFLLQLSALALPFYLQLTIDEAIGQGDTSLLTILLLGFGLVYALNAITRALREWVVLTLGESLSFQLGGNVVRHLLRLPLGYFERRHVGDLLSRIGSVQPIQALLTQGLVNVFIDAALLVTTLAVMALISPLLSAVVLAFSLAYLVVSLVLYPGLRRRTEEEIVARAKEETYLLESMRAMRAIKLHGHETARENGWRNRYAEVISASYRAQMFGIGLGLGEGLLFGLQFLLVVYLGALAVMGQHLSIGLLLAFLAYRSSFTTSAAALVEQLQKWRLLQVHLDRLSDIVAQNREQVRSAVPRQMLPPPPLRVEGLTFNYGAGEAPILKDLNFEIPAGAFVALVGASGAGKTTLMRILLGLLPPTGGRVIADGVPLGPTSIAAWRGRVAAVLQDDLLLAGTLADNIAFFDPHFDEKRVMHVSRLAWIHGEIMRMPMGYQSLIGDMGAALSAGQRQRILLARALYRDPDMLFLDEGTANLDERTEQRIVDVIASLPVTRFVIAHRPALVERADIVLTLRDGSIEDVQYRSPRRESRRSDPRLTATAPGKANAPYR